MNCWRQWKLASSETLRNDSGNPPRSQRVSKRSNPTSVPSNPLRSTKPSRPASDSDTPLTRSGEALPRMKKPGWRAGAISQHPQQWEQVRAALNLVNDDQAGEFAERFAGALPGGPDPQGLRGQNRSLTR